MPVAEELFDPFLKIYRDLPAKAKDQKAYLLERRGPIKLLVDSVWEQTIANILHTNPRNHLEARLHINQANLDLLPSHDAKVLRSLLLVLNEYEVLGGRNPYIDRSKPLLSLVGNALRKLCIDLSTHPSHKASALAKELKALLSGEPYDSSS